MVAATPGGGWYVAEEDVAGTRGSIVTRGLRGSVTMAVLTLAGEELRDADVADDGGVWFCTERRVLRLLGPGLVSVAYTVPTALEIHGIGVGCDGLWYAAVEVRAAASGAVLFGDAGGLLGTFLQTSSPMTDVDVVPAPWWGRGGASTAPPPAPILTGKGFLGSPAGATLELRGARPLAPVLFVGGETRWSVPFAGGVLVPAPQTQVLGSTDAAGSASLPLMLSPRASCRRLYLQAVVLDASLPAGFLLSNAVSGVWD